MSARLKFDDGIKEFEVNGKELLRFNPSDPNVYRRFFEVAEELPAMEEDFRKRAERLDKEDAVALLGLMGELDKKVKERLSYVFGPENDFERILGGVNLMAVGQNGQRIVVNVLEAFQPILEEGVKQHRKEAAAEAVAQAKARRAAAGE